MNNTFIGGYTSLDLYVCIQEFLAEHNRGERCYVVVTSSTDVSCVDLKRRLEWDTNIQSGRDEYDSQTTFASALCLTLGSTDPPFHLALLGLDPQGILLVASTIPIIFVSDGHGRWKQLDGTDQLESDYQKKHK